jgi:hypothetical protein
MTLDFETVCSSGVLVTAYRSMQWLHLVGYMNPHHHENLILPNLQYCHRHQRHAVMVLLQSLEVDCSDSCGTLQAGSSIGWED